MNGRIFRLLVVINLFLGTAIIAGGKTSRPVDQDQPAELYRMGLAHHRGNGVQKNDKEAVRLWTLAAMEGHLSAQNSLAWMYEQGLGVEKNLPLAYAWYSRASDAGDASAQYDLGLMNQQGRGVAPNDLEALRLYILAAESGEPRAQCALGEMYAHGKAGLDKDIALAIQWYRKAIDNGSERAQTLLDGLQAE